MLAKPFTRDGMVRILKKHLSWMLKDPLSGAMIGDENPMQAMSAGQLPSTSQQQAYAGLTNMAGGPNQQQQIKFEQTPIPSPTTTSSWHSPGQMTHPSPNMGDGNSGGYMNSVGSAAGPGGMVLTPGGTQRSQQQQQQQQYANHVMAQVGIGGGQNMGGQLSADGLGGLGTGGAGGGGDERPEKRQRTIYGQPQGAFVQ